jgi:hypothetical protein
MKKDRKIATYVPTYLCTPCYLATYPIVAIFLPTYLLSFFLMGFLIGKKLGHIGK